MTRIGFHGQPLALLAGTALTLAPLLTPSDAAACGGNFCDSGPTSMPVDQTGENILFEIGPDYVEAHIQIQIDTTTEAEKFAWVIPVTALPEFAIGSERLFENMLAGSVPRYGSTTQTEFCGSPGEDDGGSGDGDGDPTTSGGATGDGDDGPSEPTVVYQASVGAYEIAVLDGGTVEGVMQWLGDNGYQQDPAAEPILAEYLAEDFLFVALKLGVDQDIADIHPIVIRYAGTEPCVPIRLTRIAAAEDMDIRTFFLGDARTVPINYRHVLINPLMLDWFNQADNYKEVISMAVDADHADGHAFVTEYAGPSNVISLFGVYDETWDAAAIAGLADSPVGLYDVLASQGLMSCSVPAMTCNIGHTQLQPLLDQYVPVPAGVNPIEFWACMDCYADLVDLEAWDPVAFSQAFDERIVQPGLRAFDLVTGNPYLTRMYTTLSPNEMTADPMFRENPTLPEVERSRMASRYDACDGSTTVTLPDGREVYFGPNKVLTWPHFQGRMPWAEAVEQEGMAEAAPLIRLADNTEQIDALLDEWNRQGAGATGEDPSADDNGGDCACSVDEDQPLGLAFGLATLGLFGLIRRRRS